MDLPKINPEVAELCGIITGDGSLSKSKNGTYTIEIAGDKKEELEYLNYASLLFKKCFNKSLKLRIEEDYARVYARSKKILEYFERIGLIIGKKSRTARIPEIILRNKSFSLRFLRGLADSDFTFMIKNRNGKIYPQVKGCSKSGILIEQISSILKELEINHCTCFEKSYYRKRKKLYERHVIYINGFDNVREWFLKIGFSNSRHTEKYQQFLRKRAGEDSNSRPKGNSIR